LFAGIPANTIKKQNNISQAWFPPEQSLSGLKEIPGHIKNLRNVIVQSRGRLSTWETLQLTLPTMPVAPVTKMVSFINLTVLIFWSIHVW